MSEYPSNRVRAITNDKAAAMVPVTCTSEIHSRQQCGCMTTVVQACMPNKGFAWIGYQQHGDSVLGKGSFGSVRLIRMTTNHELVALKTVTMDPRYANRELEFLLRVKHQNIVSLKFYYLVQAPTGAEDNSPQALLNIGMEYLPETLYAFLRRYRAAGFYVPVFTVKLVMYQIFRALAYLHQANFCHRDLKPQNILIDETTGMVKLCDLGSMKHMTSGTPSVAYICSRYYRAPELLCGSTTYTCAIDLWSAGCTFAECILQTVLFPGQSTPSQLACILRALGSPTEEENTLFCEEAGIKATLHTPAVPAFSIQKIMPEHTPESAIELISELLCLVPSQRESMASAMFHPFFDELSFSGCMLDADTPLPPLFNFSDRERIYLDLGHPRAAHVAAACERTAGSSAATAAAPRRTVSIV